MEELTIISVRDVFATIAVVACLAPMAVMTGLAFASALGGGDAFADFFNRR